MLECITGELIKHTPWWQFQIGTNSHTKEQSGVKWDREKERERERERGNHSTLYKRVIVDIPNWREGFFHGWNFTTARETREAYNPPSTHSCYESLANNSLVHNKYNIPRMLAQWFNVYEKKILKVFKLLHVLTAAGCGLGTNVHLYVHVLQSAWR